MRYRFLLFSVLVCACLLIGCAGEKKPPARTDIPVIKDAISKVETGVREHNRAALDSLMSVKMLDAHLTSDSLILLVWNSIPLSRFARFSDCEIAYSSDIAQCDCGITDETGERQAGITLSFAREDKRWLLREFKLISSDTPQ